MDLNSSSPEQHDGATASPETSSARPNPFSDNDIARKRRRTSASMSPSLPHTIVIPAHEIHDAVDIERERHSHSTPGTPKKEPLSPRTPEEFNGQHPHMADPTPSKVTINLRHRHRSSSQRSSYSDTPSDNSNVILPQLAVGKENITVKSVEAAMTTAANDHESATGLAPGSLNPSIPDIAAESNHIQAIPGPHNVASSRGLGDPVLIDPSSQFPGLDVDSTLLEALQRLCRYIKTKHIFDGEVLLQVQDWIQDYLNYLSQVDCQMFLESALPNQSFWLEFPDIVQCLESRKHAISKSAAIQPIVLSIFSGFAQMTGKFVILDCHILHESLEDPRCIDEGELRLFSEGYLHHLHCLMQTQEPSMENERLQLMDPSSNQWDRASYLFNVFQNSPGGSIESLSRLATALVELTERQPTFADTLTPITQVLAHCLAEAVSALRIHGTDEAEIAKRLEDGHTVWLQLSTSLQRRVEKHFAHLSGESLSFEIHALTDMLKACLHGDHSICIDMLQGCRQRYIALPSTALPEAVAYRWRFETLAKVIQSSQMQLRVIAVTTMCTDLVDLFTRYRESENPGTASFLTCIGDCLLESSLIDYILRCNCHPEIISESGNIIGFLIVSGIFRTDHMDLLWRGITTNLDSRTADALMRMVTTITNLFSENWLLYLCDKFQSLPLESFTFGVRTFWESIMRELVVKSKEAQTPLSLPPYDLCLRLLRKASAYTLEGKIAFPEMRMASLQKFKELLAYGPTADGRQQLYLSCIEDISSKSATSLGSLWGLFLAIRPAIANEIRALIKRYQLTKLVVEELESAVNMGKRSESQRARPVLSGVANQPRRDFITNIAIVQPSSIGDALGEKLWAMLVGVNSTCEDDRDAGWQILNTISADAQPGHPFLDLCYSAWMPNLLPSCFCRGALEFVKKKILFLVNNNDSLLEPESITRTSHVEQIWRFILTAQDSKIVSNAIRTLTVDIYLESKAVNTCSSYRAQQLHLLLVNRCLEQLKDAARNIQTDDDTKRLTDNDETRTSVITSKEVEAHKLSFVRSLQVLRLFLEAHQSRPRFAAPDVRPYMSKAPLTIEGELAELKYQSFDGCKETDIKPLNIGILNTAASLLASLSYETGFENYSAYYRGRQLQPSEHDICKSLQELNIHDGLVLVRKEESKTPTSTHVKPGSSPLEIEILGHFQDLWMYLSMQDNIAKEMYNFLTKLPADGHVMALIHSGAVSYNDLFLVGRPFKSLYVIHAIGEYTFSASSSAASLEGSPDLHARLSSDIAATRSMQLVVQAIADEKVIERAPHDVRTILMNSMISTFLRLLQLSSPGTSISVESVGSPPISRFIKIFCNSTQEQGGDMKSLIANIMTVILRLGSMDSQFWDHVKNDQAFWETTRHLMLFDNRSAVRKALADAIKNSIEDSFDGGTQFVDSDAMSPIATSVWSHLSTILPQTLSLSEQSYEIFDLLEFLLLRMSTLQPLALAIDIPTIAGKACELLLMYHSTEDLDHSKPVDYVTKGLTSILHICLQKDQSLAIISRLPRDVGLKLFWRHLFPQERTGPGSLVQKVILNTVVRSKLNEIILCLVKHDRQQFQSLLDALNSLVPFYEDDEDPYLYELPYQFDRQRAIRSTCGYVGLRNLSNTCYFNSLMTQLFMNPAFRQFIIDANITQPEESQKLLYYTQNLFGYMQESYRRFVDPSDVVGSVKTYDDTPIDIHSQMDVDEFYNLLFDRWEAQLANSNEKKTFRSFYGGQLVQQVKSRECEHISERLEPFSAIQCDIKGKSTLEESLQAYVDGEVLEGDNKYKCSTCDKHVDAVKRACFKDLPNNLIFHLKRFDFNLRTLQRSKINDYFAFPSVIDLRPYTVEFLSGSTAECSEEIFELVGILVHSGTAESGHYYSYIKERTSSDDKWVEFNDDNVTSWNAESMENSTFGGPERRQSYDTGTILYNKAYSAYMLFYERKKSRSRAPKGVADLIDPTQPRVGISKDLQHNIYNENTVILRRHCLFDTAHIQFVQACFNHARVLDSEKISDRGSVDSTAHESMGNSQRNRHSFKNTALEMAISHLDQIVTRAKDIPHFGEFSMMIETAVAGCSQCAFAYYNYFNVRHQAFRALLQRNPEPSVRIFVGRALITSLEIIAASAPHLYGKPVSVASSIHSDDEMGDEEDVTISGIPSAQSSVLLGVLSIFDYLWRFFHVHLRSWDEYFGLILAFAKMGGREVAHLLHHDYLLRLLRIIAVDRFMELPPNYVRMLHNIQRRANSRPPSYIAIIGTIDHIVSCMAPVLGPEVIVESADERLNQDEEFFWTEEEVHVIHDYPDQLPMSLFAEKLIGIDQSLDVTHGLLRRIIATGSQMDSRIAGAIFKNTQGDISTTAMDPFIRAAAVYIECTPSLMQAQEVVRHICSQVRSLENSEGSTFIEFIHSALNCEQQDTDFAASLRDYSAGIIPIWAPFLLMYEDGVVRRDTEQLIDDELFESTGLQRLAQTGTMGEDEGEDENELDTKHDMICQLGLRCIAYLREAHVERRKTVVKSMATPMIRVITKCGPYIEMSTEINEEGGFDFAQLRTEVVEPFLELVVDMMEDDGSDWDGSCGSSSQTGGNVVLDLQTNDLNEASGM